MFPYPDPQFQRQHILQRQEALRRSAGASRLRRELKRERRQHRAGP